MKVLQIILLCLAAIIAHSTIMKLFAIGPFRPDMLLFVLVYVSIKEGSNAGVWTGFAIGLLQDVYLPSSLGINAFAKSIVGFAVGFLNEKQWKIDVWARSFILLAAFFLHDIITYLLRTGHLQGIVHNLFFHSLPSYVYTLAIWAVLWILLRRKEKSV